jgi:hypothetical protein
MLYKLIVIPYYIVSFLTRSSMVWTAYTSHWLKKSSLLSLLKVFYFGFIQDTIFISFFLMLIYVITSVLPKKVRNNQRIFHFANYIYFLILGFGSVIEHWLWSHKQERYNLKFFYEGIHFQKVLTSYNIAVFMVVIFIIYYCLNKFFSYDERVKLNIKEFILTLAIVTFVGFFNSHKFNNHKQITSVERKLSMNGWTNLFDILANRTLTIKGKNINRELILKKDS